MGSPPIKLDDITKKDGKLDQVFSISKPSLHKENFDLMNFNEDEQALYDRLIGVEEDKQELFHEGSTIILNKFDNLFEDMFQRSISSHLSTKKTDAMHKLELPSSVVLFVCVCLRFNGLLSQIRG